jgi:hypothetical protein
LIDSVIRPGQPLGSQQPAGQLDKYKDPRSGLDPPAGTRAPFPNPLPQKPTGGDDTDALASLLVQHLNGERPTGSGEPGQPPTVPDLRPLKPEVPSWAQGFRDLFNQGRPGGNLAGGPDGSDPANPTPAVPPPPPAPGGTQTAGPGGSPSGGAGGTSTQPGSTVPNLLDYLAAHPGPQPQQPAGQVPDQAPHSGLAPPLVGNDQTELIKNLRAGLAHTFELPADSGGAAPWSQALNRMLDQDAYQHGQPVQGPLALPNLLSKGLTDSAVDPLYNGLDVMKNPEAAAQASANRWGAAVNGDLGPLRSDYWNHPGRSLAEDLNNPFSTALGSINPLSNPVVSSYVGDAVGGLVHMGVTEAKRWGPALYPNLARAFGMHDPNANLKNDYVHDPWGTLGQDLGAAATVGSLAVGGGAGGALGGATRGAVGGAARGTAEAGAEAAARSGAEAGAQVGAEAPLAGKPAGPPPGAATPAPPGPRVLPRPETGTPTARPPAGPTEPKPTAKPGGKPTGQADHAPTGPAGPRPGHPTGIAGRRPGGTADPEQVKAGGNNKPLVTAGGAGRRGAPAGDQAGSLNDNAGPPPGGNSEGRSGTGRSENDEPLTTSGGTPAHKPPSAKGDGATGGRSGVDDYLGRADVRAALRRADDAGLTVKVKDVDRPVSHAITEGLSRHPELVRALSTAKDLHSSLLTRPETFANLLTHPEAVAHFERAIAALNKLGPRKLLERGKAALRRQPVTLTPEEQDIVAALRDTLKDLPKNERYQTGFDKTRTGDGAYKQEYLAKAKAKAAEIQPALTKIAKQLAELIDPGRGKAAGRKVPKSDRRAMDKIDDPDGYNGDASQLVDLAGAKVEFNSVDKVYQALDAVRQIPGIKIVRFKDRLTGPQESGYGDLLLNVRMGNGHVGELRLQLAPAERVSSSEHTLYETTRDLEARAKDQHRDLTPREEAFKHEILRRTNSMYRDVFEGGVR